MLRIPFACTVYNIASDGIFIIVECGFELRKKIVSTL